MAFTTKITSFLTQRKGVALFSSLAGSIHFSNTYFLDGDSSYVSKVRCEDASATSSESNREDEATFLGQCPKRQVWVPKIPYPAWDYNWDGKMTKETSLEGRKASKGAKVPGVTRHVILIRHGQYDETHQEDEKRKLTKLGREQAELTGKRLATLLQGGKDEKLFGRCKIKIIRVSDMTRAKETAEIISKYLPDVDVAEPDCLLNEGIPAQVIPIRPELGVEKAYDQNHEAIESAFQKYFYRSTVKLPTKNEEDNDDAEEKQYDHEFEIIVGHGNVIRYFFCRALQLPPEAWLRLSIFNCSMTYIMVNPSGTASCRFVGDIGHLGYEHSTFSMFHGFTWG